MPGPLEELTRVPIRHYTYGGAEITVWVGVYQISDLVERRVLAGGLSATVDGLDVPVELHPQDGEAELLAKVRRWIDDAH